MISAFIIDLINSGPKLFFKILVKAFAKTGQILSLFFFLYIEHMMELITMLIGSYNLLSNCKKYP